MLITTYVLIESTCSICRINIVKIFASAIIISLLFTENYLVFLQLHNTYIYINSKINLLIGRAKHVMF